MKLGPKMKNVLLYLEEEVLYQIMMTSKVSFTSGLTHRSRLFKEFPRFFTPYPPPPHVHIHERMYSVNIAQQFVCAFKTHVVRAHALK